MKKINFLFLISLVSLSMFSCKEQDNFYKGETYTYFKTEQATISENATEPIVIDIVSISENPNPDNVNDLTLTFTGATEGVDFNVVSTKTPSLGEGYATTISIIPIDNSSKGDTKELVITISAATVGNIGLGADNPDINYIAPKKSVTITILDDDSCPEFGNTLYSGSYTYNSIADNCGFGWSSADVTISAGANADEFVVGDFQGAGTSLILKYDDATGTIEIPSQDSPYTIGGELALWSGNGTFERCDVAADAPLDNPVFNLTYDLASPAGSCGGGTCTFTKN